MKAEQVMRKMGAMPMHVCDAIEWFCYGNTVFDPINIEKWLRHRRLMADVVSVRDALERAFGREVADAVEENIRNGGERR